MPYTLGEAAKATGKSKATISKSIKSGKISASKGVNGAYQIEPSELFRVYPSTGQISEQVNSKETPKETHTINLLEAKLEAAMQRLQDKEEQLDDMRSQRDRWQQQATSLLADLRPKAEKNDKGFFKRLFG